MCISMRIRNRPLNTIIHLILVVYCRLRYVFLGVPTIQMISYDAFLFRHLYAFSSTKSSINQFII